MTQSWKWYLIISVLFHLWEANQFIHAKLKGRLHRLQIPGERDHLVPSERVTVISSFPESLVPVRNNPTWMAEIGKKRMGREGKSILSHPHSQKAWFQWDIILHGWQRYERKNMGREGGPCDKRACVLSMQFNICPIKLSFPPTILLGSPHFHSLYLIASCLALSNSFSWYYENPLSTYPRPIF